jgi:hypothetical protein
MNDVNVLGLFCVIGYAKMKAHIPFAPLMLGVMLGDAIEPNLIRAVSTEPDPWLFVTRQISGLLSAAFRHLATSPGALSVSGSTLCHSRLNFLCASQDVGHALATSFSFACDDIRYAEGIEPTPRFREIPALYRCLNCVDTVQVHARCTDDTDQCRSDAPDLGGLHLAHGSRWRSEAHT